jgi:hypothetical protein
MAAGGYSTDEDLHEYGVYQALPFAEDSEDDEGDGGPPTTAEEYLRRVR